MSFISQLAPSESSVMRKPGREYVFLRHPRDHLGIEGVKKIFMRGRIAGGHKTIVVQMENGTPGTEMWRALYGAATFQSAAGKIVVASGCADRPKSMGRVRNAAWTRLKDSTE